MINKRNLLAMTLLASVLMTANTTQVSAAETSDTVFAFAAGSSYRDITARQKTNTTPVYVKIDATRPKAYVRVMGYIPSSSTGSLSWKNCTLIKSTVIAKPGIASSIRSTVYEMGGRSVKLSGRAVSGKMTGGVWSPDSTRTYRVINNE